ncbi:MAG: N-acetylmuramoyl-L-alanine amidase [Negativicutes bacterium]
MIRILFMILALVTTVAAPVSAAEDDGALAPAEVKAVRVGNSADRFRLVVDVDREIDYDTMVLSNPGRIVINLHNARLGDFVEREMAPGGRFVSRIRMGQFDKTTVRIVLETEAAKDTFTIFPLTGGASPYRVVMDIGAGKGNAGNSTASGNAQKPADSDGGDSTSGDTDSKDTKETGDKEDKGKAEKPVDLPDIDLKEIELSSVLKGKKIVLDPGHGGEDPGAIGPTGVTEKSITLRVAETAQALLEEAGAKVIMTRTEDTEVSPKHRQATDIDELQARCDIANKAGADIFISIHMDSFVNRKAGGTTSYYYAKGSAASRKLAAAIQDAVVKEIGTESRGVKSCNFYVVRHTKMPAILLEVAFVSNPQEEKLLDSDIGVKHAAVGLARGIAAFFGG